MTGLPSASLLLAMLHQPGACVCAPLLPLNFILLLVLGMSVRYHLNCNYFVSAQNVGNNFFIILVAIYKIEIGNLNQYFFLQAKHIMTSLREVI